MQGRGINPFRVVVAGIGKVLIDKPYAFALIKMIEPNLGEFIDKEILADKKNCKILKGIKQS